MKKSFSLWVLSLLVLWLTWCWNNASIEEEVITSENNTWTEIIEEIEENNNTPENTIINFIAEEHSCDDNSKLFSNIAILWTKALDNWETEYYINTKGQWYFIDERGNLMNSCWFDIPMKFVVSENDWKYKIEEYEQAKDWSDYTESINEMFSEEAAKKLFDENYSYQDNRSLLEMAEEYYWVTIIPTEKKEYSCAFCDKLWYFEENNDDSKQFNELVFNYVSENNWKNTIYFGNDWTFEAKGSWDEGKWTWVFWNDENSVIVSMSEADHVYDRYIITHVDENKLNTILEIIQK